MSKLIQNTKAVKLWFESKKSLTYNLRISFLIKESKKNPTEITLTLIYLWEKLKYYIQRI